MACIPTPVEIVAVKGKGFSRVKTTAEKESKVFFLPKDLFQFKPNARWAEAYEYPANIIY